MSSVNKVIIIGNLTRDPEVRNTQSGDKIIGLTVATSDRWKDKATGEQKERAEYHRVSIMQQGMATVAEAYLAKGSKVYLEGELRTRKWSDQSGVERYTTEIVLSGYNSKLVLLDAHKKESEFSAKDYAKATGGTVNHQEPLDDEIPF